MCYDCLTKTIRIRVLYQQAIMDVGHPDTAEHRDAYIQAREVMMSVWNMIDQLTMVMTVDHVNSALVGLSRMYALRNDLVSNQRTVH